jgi:hypothetical protein
LAEEGAEPGTTPILLIEPARRLVGSARVPTGHERRAPSGGHFVLMVISVNRLPLRDAKAGRLAFLLLKHWITFPAIRKTGRQAHQP